MLHKVNRPESLWFLNTRVDIVVAASSGADNISVLRHRAPFGDSPPLHIHETEDEIFHVLEGTVRFRVDGKEFKLEAGETILAPKNIPHTYCIESPAGGSWMTTTTPGDFEGLVREIGRPAENEELPIPAEPTREQIQALTNACIAHRITLIGPPLMPARPA